MHPDTGIPERFDYDAFISYRRSDGTPVARWLHDYLQSYRLPTGLGRGRSPLRTYIDTSYARANEDFWSQNIEPALLRSRCLILIATPDCLVPRGDGTPNWVQREITSFRSRPQPGTIFVVRGAGEASDPLPEGITERSHIIDLRPASRWSSRLNAQEKLDEETLGLVAALYGIPDAQMPLLREEGKRRARASRRRFATIAAIVAAANTASAMIGSNYAVRQSAKEKMALDLVSAVKGLKEQVDSLEDELALAVKASLSLKVIKRTYAVSNEDQNAALGPGGDGDEALRSAHNLAVSADLELLKEIDLMVMVNAHGRLFYTRADETQMNQDFSQVPIIKAALGGVELKDLKSTAFVHGIEASAGVKLLPEASDQGLFAVYAAPYMVDHQIYGAVLLGKQVRRDWLERLEKLAHAKVVLRARDDDTAISTTVDLRELPRKAWRGGEQPVPIVLGGEAYLAVAGNVERSDGEAMATVMLLRDEDAEVRPIVAAFWRALPGVVLSSLVISIAMTIVLSRRLARLTDAA